MSTKTKTKKARSADVDEALLAALARGLSFAEAAQAAGVSLTAVFRRLEDRGFRQRLEERQALAFRQVVSLATEGLAAALTTLRELAGSGRGKGIRRQAAQKLLEACEAVVDRQGTRDWSEAGAKKDAPAGSFASEVAKLKEEVARQREARHLRESDEHH